MKKTIGLILIGVVIMTLALGRASTNNFVEDVKQYIAYGWMEEPEARTWTYVETLTTSSVDVYVVNVNEDVTGLIGPNLKVRLSNPTVKYFGVLSVGAYAAGVTPVYLFGGTDYVLDGGQPITDVAFSNARAPFGFPLSEDKWAVEIIDSTLLAQATPTASTWYNFLSIILPQGEWDISYQAFGTTTYSSSVSINLYSTLSTANNTLGDNSLTDVIWGVPLTDIKGKLRGREYVALSSETQYYLNFMTTMSSTSFAVFGTTLPTVIRAVWGGL